MATTPEPEVLAALFRAVGHLERCLLSIAEQHPEFFNEDADSALENAVREHRLAAELWLGHPITDD